MDFSFPPHPTPSIAIAGVSQRFPVHRIYCVGRNYADHAKEMGAAVNKENPVFFLKPADAVVADGSAIPYPLATANLHHEVEMVVALDSGGSNIATADALKHVYGYAVGLDLTRRDLQAKAKAQGLPWDTGKAFDQSAPISAIHRASEIGHLQRGELRLEVNGEIRQRADISDMIFPLAEIIHVLSDLFELKSGDLIFTGTPAGVAALKSGDHFRAKLANAIELHGSIA